MDPLTPNTSAFLSMLAASIGNDIGSTTNAQNNLNENAYNPFDLNAFGSYNTTPVAAGANKPNPASLPPSAFFPIPGRDTPEDTPPSTNEASHSPEKALHPEIQVKKSLSDVSGESDADNHGGNRRASASHKRKAPKANQNNKHVDDELDDEDEESDVGDEHEDKRVHQNAKGGAAKKGGRKSVEGGKETKAARRKEQNRAAQKAFRERREAKVKDLEDKVAELERKSYGTSVENENLRGILKRLQEENVALRQAAFTFSMPVSGAPQSGSATGASTPLVGMPQRQQRKPLSPPNSTDDVLQSIHDVPAGVSRQTSRDVQSPDSLHSINSRHGSTSEASGSFQSPPNLFQDPSNAFNVAALGGARPSLAPHDSASSNSTQSTSARSNSGISPASTSTNGRTELDALWASFLEAGAPQKDQSQAWNVNAPNIMGAFNNQANGMSFADPNAKVASATTNDWDKLAFRDGSAQQAAQPLAQQPRQGLQPPVGSQQADPWSGMMDNSMDDFLASLTGSNALGGENDLGTNDEDFNAQLQQILGSNNASPSSAFALPGANPFSPTNYLNMSPSPLASVSASNEPSPATQSGSSASTSTSPESLIEPHDSTNSLSTKYSPEPSTKSEHEPIYVVDDSGKVIKPSELWIKMGMQHESNLEHLLIDDLCDMMRSKATCKDGKAVLHASDAENIFRYKGADPVHTARMTRLEQRAGVTPGAFTGPH